jgi:cell wall assembly regulator SMI1
MHEFPKGSAANSLPRLLDRLDKWLKQHRPGMLMGLRPGASPEVLDAWQARLGIAVPVSLRTLLAWHNGQKEEVLGGFEQDWRLMSTTQIEQARRELLRDAQSEVSGAGWRPAWLPIFEDDNGDYLYLDTSTDPAPLRAYWLGQAEHPVVAPSLEAWFGDFVSAVEKGKYHEEAERGTFYRKH